MTLFLDCAEQVNTNLYKDGASKINQQANFASGSIIVIVYTLWRSLRKNVVESLCADIDVLARSMNELRLFY